MRILRYLLYALIQLGIIGGGLWLYSAVRGISILETNFYSGHFLTLVGFSFLPLIRLILRQSKLLYARVPGIRSMPFVLKSSFRGDAEGSLSHVRTEIRKICNTTVLDDRVFVLVGETEDTLEYETQPRLEELGGKRKKRRFEPTRVEICFEHHGQPSTVRVQISSYTDGQYVGIDNTGNEENVAVIVTSLQRAGLLPSPAPRGRLRGRVSSKPSPREH